MGFRFRKSFKLAPGIRMKLTGGGLSWTVGPRGASVNFGQRGTFLNAGLSGTGLYSRQRLGGSSDAVSASDRAARISPPAITQAATVRISDDRAILFLDRLGNPLSEQLTALAKKQNGEAIHKLIDETCNKINQRVESLGAIHLHTPAPHDRIRYVAISFSDPEPRLPIPKSHGFLGWMFKFVRIRIDSENAAASALSKNDLDAWNRKRAEHEAIEKARRELLEERVLTDSGVMEEILEHALGAIEWPRETAISAEVNDGGLSVLLDVDLPEIEDMPKTVASVPARGFNLNIKQMSLTKIQTLYMQHIHGVGFRIVGESFAVLPKAQHITLSAFSQRPDKATGATKDDYLYSIRVAREEWEKINFGNLKAIDAIEAFNRFELRRDMSSTGAFRAIQPFETLSRHAHQASGTSEDLQHP